MAKALASLSSFALSSSPSSWCSSSSPSSSSPPPPLPPPNRSSSPSPPFVSTSIVLGGLPGWPSPRGNMHLPQQHFGPPTPGRLLAAGHLEWHAMGPHCAAQRTIVMSGTMCCEEALSPAMKSWARPQLDLRYAVESDAEPGGGIKSTRAGKPSTKIGSALEPLGPGFATQSQGLPPRSSPWSRRSAGVCGGPPSLPEDERVG